MRKTAHYRRSGFVRGEGMTMQQAIGLCHDNYPDEGFPIFPYVSDLDCIVAEHAARNGRDFLHLVVFEQGAGAAVVETIQSVRVDEEPAPEEKEFIQSQVFLICSGDDVIFTTHNTPLRDSRINVLTNNLIENYCGEQNPPLFLLEAALDEEKYRQLMDQGIGEIDLGVGGYQQTLEYVLNNGHIERAGLFSTLKSLIKPDLSEEEREAAAKISGRFVLRPGFDWNDAQVKELMTDMAMNLLDDEEADEGFTIVTKNGLRISRDYVRVKDSFAVDGNRQVVDVRQIFQGLEDAFDQFEGMGVIDSDEA